MLEADLRELQQRGASLDGVTADSLRQFFARGEYTIQVDPIVSLRTMLEMAPLLRGFYREMKWTVIRTAGERLFLTSNNPVAKGDPGHHGGMRGIGLYSLND